MKFRTPRRGVDAPEALRPFAHEMGAEKPAGSENQEPFTRNDAHGVEL
jgi:hypothetical protein